MPLSRYPLPSSLSVRITVSLYRVVFHGVKTEYQYMGFNTHIHSKNFIVSRGLDAEDFSILGAI